MSTYGGPLRHGETAPILRPLASAPDKQIKDSTVPASTAIQHGRFIRIGVKPMIGSTDYTLCMQHAKSGRLVTIGYATRDAAQLPGSMRLMSPSKSVSKLNTASMPRDSHSATIDASVKLMSWSSYRRNASRDA